MASQYTLLRLMSLQAQQQRQQKQEKQQYARNQVSMFKDYKQGGRKILENLTKDLDNYTQIDVNEDTKEVSTPQLDSLDNAIDGLKLGNPLWDMEVGTHKLLINNKRNELITKFNIDKKIDTLSNLNPDENSEGYTKILNDANTQFLNSSDFYTTEAKEQILNELKNFQAKSDYYTAAQAVGYDTDLSTPELDFADNITKSQREALKGELEPLAKMTFATGSDFAGLFKRMQGISEKPGMSLVEPPVDESEKNIKAASFLQTKLNSIDSKLNPADLDSFTNYDPSNKSSADMLNAANAYSIVPKSINEYGLGTAKEKLPFIQMQNMAVDVDRAIMNYLRKSTQDDTFDRDEKLNDLQFMTMNPFDEKKRLLMDTFIEANKTGGQLDIENLTKIPGRGNFNDDVRFGVFELIEFREQLYKMYKDGMFMDTIDFNNDIKSNTRPGKGFGEGRPD